MNKKLRTIEEAVAYLITADVAVWEPKDRATCPTAYSVNIDPYTNGEEFKFVLLMDGQREPALMTNDEREVIDWANGLMECLSCMEEDHE